MYTQNKTKHCPDIGAHDRDVLSFFIPEIDEDAFCTRVLQPGLATSVELLIIIFQYIAMGRYSRSRSRSHSRSRSRSRSLSPSEEGVRLHVADLGIDCSKREIERTFEKFGPLLEVWLARNPPCFAFIVFKYREDAEEAMREMDGK